MGTNRGTRSPGLTRIVSGAGWNCQSCSHSPSPSPRGFCCRAVARQHRGRLQDLHSHCLGGRPLANQHGGQCSKVGISPQGLPFCLAPRLQRAQPGNRALHVPCPSQSPQQDSFPDGRGVSTPSPAVGAHTWPPPTLGEEHPPSIPQQHPSTPCRRSTHPSVPCCGRGALIHPSPWPRVANAVHWCHLLHGPGLSPLQNGVNKHRDGTDRISASDTAKQAAPAFLPHRHGQHLPHLSPCPEAHPAPSASRAMPCHPKLPLDRACRGLGVVLWGFKSRWSSVRKSVSSSRLCIQTQLCHSPVRS